ncbi:peroxiredoxin-like family protein [Actinomadura rupiterrae]|uniref:peroxiredoxin-like family protein n=1 Tax=Actinomadura rupiterrae TaxID=559627 RepID=UPI0020A25E82|nr:peroxiredoxin-like family protein [Actinomadura rupiterrae]MCP2341000.1 peroxiredoxin [Actinomadura rupiterrae]
MRTYELTSVTGAPVRVPDPERIVHLQFRRFAGCPICNLHLRSFAVRHAEIEAAGVREVAVFHAPADELREHVAELPFDVIPDPDRKLYAEFGVESRPRALLDPRVWPAIVRAVVTGLLRRDPLPKSRPTGGRLGLPGDFLIAPDGTVLASKLGAHADDQWPLDEMLALTKSARPERVRQG